MTEYLWSDERIQHAIDIDASFEGEYGEGIMIVATDNAHAAMQQMRDDYEANRNDLQAEIDRLTKERGELNSIVDGWEKSASSQNEIIRQQQAELDKLKKEAANPKQSDAPAWRAYEIMVDNLEAAKQEIAAKDAELDRLRTGMDETLGIGMPHLDGLTETQLERYSQLSPPEMYRLLLAREAELVETKVRLSGTEAAWDDFEELMFGGDSDE